MQNKKLLILFALNSMFNCVDKFKTKFVLLNVDELIALNVDENFEKLIVFVNDSSTIKKILTSKSLLFSSSKLFLSISNC